MAARQSERTPGTILADSSQAKKKYGFGGPNGSPITSAPKMSDMWFVEFTGADGLKKEQLSSFARAVSPVSMTPEVSSVDKYGKRVYFPTYMNFSEVSLSFYDKVDGSAFVLIEELYRRYFKNADLKVDAGNIQSTITEINSGRKFSQDAETKGYVKSFEKITIYHWFGSFDRGAPGQFVSPNDIADPRGNAQTGALTSNNDGLVQKIVLVNPLVTTISLSGSDYSDSSLRTVDINFQPENVIISSSVEESVAIPSWMQEGLEYVIDSAETDQSRYVVSRLKENLKYKNQLTQFETENFTDVSGAVSGDTARQQLQELKKLSGTLKVLDESTTATPGERQAAIEKYLEQKNITMPMTAASLNNYTRSDTSNNPYSSDILYPSVAGFPESRLAPGGSDRFTSIDLANLVSNELISSLLNGRKIDMNNITNGVAQGILGNTGIGTLQNMTRTSQSRFGVFGDMVRDSLIKSTRLGTNNQGLKSTTVSTRPISTPTTSQTADFSDKDLDKSGLQFNSSSRTGTQNNINNLKNLTRGTR